MHIDNLITAIDEELKEVEKTAPNKEKQYTGVRHKTETETTETERETTETETETETEEEESEEL